MAAEEDDLIDGLSRGRLPPAVQVVLGHDAPLVLQQAHRPVREALHPDLKSRQRSQIKNQHVHLTIETERKEKFPIMARERNGRRWKGQGSTRASQGRRRRGRRRPGRRQSPLLASPWQCGSLDVDVEEGGDQPEDEWKWRPL